MTAEASGRLPRAVVSQNPALAAFGDSELVSELLSRMRNPASGESLVGTERMLLLEAQLFELLEKRLDVPLNRWSIALVAQHFVFTRWCWQKHHIPMEGARHVDLGCGSHNPLGRMFAHVLLGVRDATAIDLDEPLDMPASVRHLSRMVAAAIIDPSRVFPHVDVRRDTILAHVADFDLARMAAGDPAGIPSRLRFLKRSVADTGLPPAGADVLVSNSLMEHLPDVPAALAEWARITAPGGYGMHVIDVTDHRHYTHPEVHPLEFLTVDDPQPIVYASNRLRLPDFVPLFEAAGFELIELEQLGHTPLSDSIRDRLVAPWSHRPHEQLEYRFGRFLVRKRR
jgi:SAM-dependent methyltransferase